MKIKVKQCKKILIEYLYLDLKTCQRCMGTDKVLDSVLLTLKPVLEVAGFSVEYRKIEIESADMAIQYQFLSSPTIRVNSEDIFQSVVENDCGCCSEISGTKVKCRVFEYEGRNYEVPTRQMLVNAILRSIYGEHTNCSNEYHLPENLKEFFEGKQHKKLTK